MNMSIEATEVEMTGSFQNSDNARKTPFSRSGQRGSQYWPKLKACSHILFFSGLVLSGCSSPAKKPDGINAVRSKLSQLQADPNLSSLSPVALKEAEEAVTVAEQPTRDKELAEHRLWMAQSRVEIAAARAQSRYNENQRSTLSENRESARLTSRTQEADNARAKTQDLLQQIAEMNARPTDRGLVMTLGDILFASGEAELMGGSINNLDKLAQFLKQYPERTAEIEGHTDNVGSSDLNLGLSQRRAESVKNYLVEQGVGSNRLSATGKGLNSPVADNRSAAGRQQNRRVEIIISDTGISSTR